MSQQEYRDAVADLILQNRLALGMSQELLAQRIGVSVAAVSRWELGQRSIRAFTHTKVKRFFKAEWTRRGTSLEEVRG